MAEVTGQDLRDHGITATALAVINFSNALNIFGRQYHSIYRNCVSGVDSFNSYEPIGVGTAKKILAVDEIDLDTLKYSGGQIQTELALKQLKLNDRIIRADRYAAIFALDDKERIDWLFRIIIAINKGFNAGLTKTVDKNIIGAFSKLLPLIEIANKTTGTRKIIAKDTPTIHKTNYAYRDGAWSNADADHFDHTTVQRIFGWLLDRQAGRVIDEYSNRYFQITQDCYMQLTPTARIMLEKTEQGQKILAQGGIHGERTTLRFVDTPHNLAAGQFMKNNTNTAYQYSAQTDKIRLATRQIKEDNTDNERVLFPSNQDMKATALNGLNDVASNAYSNIEVSPKDILAVWSGEAVSFAEFSQLSIMQQKNEVRFLNAHFYLRSEGVGTVINNENKVMLFPIKGKTV